ncbi:hypothetical protein LCGC14_1627220 [marine sediment metagenome]|uniref:Uncharacterized protein n=1 Tax=marine sediment metagenome TaxID=412755 RepID=A0A0F9IQQ4_9ZZZZ
MESIRAIVQFALLVGFFYVATLVIKCLQNGAVN